MVGLAVVGVGVDAVRHVTRRGELPIAVLPLLLGVHQLVEALVWLGLEGAIDDRWFESATWAYLLIACVVLPVYVPTALVAFESSPRRPSSLAFIAIGGVVAISLLRDIVTGPVVARVEGRHIDYRIDVWNLGIVVALYVVATCGPLLASRAPNLRWFGGANVVVAGLIAWIDNTAFVSLWCLWAAGASVSIALHLRSRPAVRAVGGIPPQVRPVVSDRRSG